MTLFYRPAHPAHQSAWSMALALTAALALPAMADGPHVERTDVVEVIGQYENGVGTSDAASAGYVTPRLIESRPM